MFELLDFKKLFLPLHRLNQSTNIFYLGSKIFYLG